jgi:predicted Fe-S protein YdhL (DUF1289 family)
MAVIPGAVPEAALDYDEILRRGGANCGDEDFAMCKCPHCGRVYLVEYEVDTLYLDSENLSRRMSIDLEVSGFLCEGCGGAFPERMAWIGAKAPESMQVTWEDLAASPWRWVATRTRESASK